MAEDVFVLHDHRPYAPSMPEVHVRTAQTYKVGAPCPDLQLDTYPQIPVLRISTITSPSAAVAPDWMSATEGAASSIHKLCCGFVYTPMLGLIFESEDILAKRKDVSYAHSYSTTGRELQLLSQSPPLPSNSHSSGVWTSHSSNPHPTT